MGLCLWLLATACGRTESPLSGGLFISSEVPTMPQVGQAFVGGASHGSHGHQAYSALRAIDPATARVQWEYRSSMSGADRAPAGLLATAGGLVCGSDRSQLLALDAKTGDPLWSMETGGSIFGTPITYAARADNS